MESLAKTTTIVFFASLTLLPTTALPDWSAKKTKNEKLSTSIISKKSSCELEAPTVVELISPIVEETTLVKNTTSDIFSQLNSYSELEADWDGAGSVIPSESDIKAVINFVESIPIGFPQPKAMLSRNGEIGLYWDDGVVYVDIEFESDNMLSVFSRHRPSKKEKFIDSVDIASIDYNWYLETLDVLLDTPELAFAA